MDAVSELTLTPRDPKPHHVPLVREVVYNDQAINGVLANTELTGDPLGP